MKKIRKKMFLLLIGIFIGVMTAIPKDIIKAYSTDIQLVGGAGDSPSNEANITFSFVTYMNSYVAGSSSDISQDSASVAYNLTDNIVPGLGSTLQTFDSALSSVSTTGQLSLTSIHGGSQSFIIRPAVKINESSIDDNYEKINGSDFTKDANGNFNISFKINNIKKGNTYIFEISSATDYFYFDDMNIMKSDNSSIGVISGGGTTIYEIFGRMKVYNKNEDRWGVLFSSQDGKKVIISRKVTSKTNIGKQTYNICVSSQNPNIVHNMGSTRTAFDGTHQADTSDNYWGLYTLSLDTNPVVGQRLADIRENLYDKIRENMKRFNRLIRILTTWIYGIAIFMAMLTLILSTLKLVMSNSHPLRRYEAIMNLLTCFICIALLGSITIITRFILEITMLG